jgi:hypothetical protein
MAKEFYQQVDLSLHLGYLPLRHLGDEETWVELEVRNTDTM